MSLRRAIAAAAVAVGMLPGTAGAQQLVGEQVRISHVGTDGDATREVQGPATAFNPVSRQYLVVWSGDETLDERHEVYGRFVTAEGAPAGGAFLIGVAGGAGDATRRVYWPQVAYNATRNEFLVVWLGDHSAVDNDVEIWARRVSAAGAPIGGQFGVSSMGPGNAAFNASHQQVVHNPRRDQYLVVWHGTDDGLPAHPEAEVFGRRISGDGAPIGGDVRIGDTTKVGAYPMVTYNSTADEYLVSFFANTAPAEDRQRASVRRVSGDGAPIGASVVVDDSATSHKTSVAFNPDRNEYLAAWPRLSPGATEIAVRRIDAAGTPLGPVREISQMRQGQAGFNAGVDIGLGYNRSVQQYLAVWLGDTPRGGGVVNHNEAYGQALNADGEEIGADDFRISTMGALTSATTGVDGRENLTSPMTFDPVTGRTLVVWSGDTDALPLAVDEREAFGRLVGSVPAPPAAPPAEPPATTSAGQAPSVPPRRVPRLVPRFRAQFVTRVWRRGGGRLGLLSGVKGVGKLPSGTTIQLVCVRDCKGSGRVTLKKKGKRKRLQLKLAKGIWITKRTIIEVRVTRRGYRGRWASHKFRRQANAVLGVRIDQGCLTTVPPYKHVRCTG